MTKILDDKNFPRGRAETGLQPLPRTNCSR